MITTFVGGEIIIETGSKALNFLEVQLKVGAELLTTLKHTWCGIRDLSLILAKVDEGEPLEPYEQDLYQLLKEEVEANGGTMKK